MKIKAKNKILVKCKRKHCKNIIDVNQVERRCKGTLSKEGLKELRGYCTMSCVGADRKYKKWEAEQMEKERKESKAKMMDGAFAVFCSLMALIKIERMKPGLLKRINREIKKYGQ